MDNYFVKEINWALNNWNSQKADIVNYYIDKEAFIKDWTDEDTLKHWNIDNDNANEWIEALNLVWDERVELNKQNLSQK